MLGVIPGLLSYLRQSFLFTSVSRTAGVLGLQMCAVVDSGEFFPPEPPP